MRRTLASALAVAATIAAPPAGATAAPVTAAPPCHRAAVAPRVVATLAVDADQGAQVVACDRAVGRRSVLRRGVTVDVASNADVLFLGRPAVHGTKVTWTEVRRRARHLTQDKVSVDVRHPRSRRSQRLSRAGGVHAFVPYASLDAFALPGGALAYIIGGPDEASGQLVLERPGRARRTLAKAMSVHVEDGRTLVWYRWAPTAEGSSWGSFDVAAVRRDAAGCPVRAAFDVIVVDTPALRLSAAREGGQSAYRLCGKATGRDGIVLSTDSLYTYLYTPVPTEGRLIALATMAVDKYQSGCSGGTVRVFDTRTGRVQRSMPLTCGTSPASALPGGA